MRLCHTPHILAPTLSAWLGIVCFACTAIPEEQSEQIKKQTGVAAISKRADERDTASSQYQAPLSFPRTLTINEATIILEPSRTLTEPLYGRFAVSELIALLYAKALKPDDKTTITIIDIHIAPLHTTTDQNAFIAVIQRKATQSRSQAYVFDIFVFRDSTNQSPVLAYTSYEPEFSYVQITGVQRQQYRITDTEYALALEWTTQYNADDKQHTASMLCLFRIQSDIIRHIFEVCTYTNITERMATHANENSAESSYVATLQERATLETIKTWGKDLYSILVTRTQTRTHTAEIGNRSETHKTKVLYQWDGMQYIQTNQLL
ncbi:MAG: hypothetical protein RML40_06175 [Bacteroidota bacterium]|nr:hypothetical protein [Candidatus Kapabacteria bacterium]MDW8220101.1 hypothetical protein [Bacteroidota bacterium]